MELMCLNIVMWMVSRMDFSCILKGSFIWDPLGVVHQTGCKARSVCISSLPDFCHP